MIILPFDSTVHSVVELTLLLLEHEPRGLGALSCGWTSHFPEGKAFICLVVVPFGVRLDGEDTFKTDGNSKATALFLLSDFSKDNEASPWELTFVSGKLCADLLFSGLSLMLLSTLLGWGFDVAVCCVTCLLGKFEPFLAFSVFTLTHLASPELEGKGIDLIDAWYESLSTAFTEELIELLKVSFTLLELFSCSESESSLYGTRPESLDCTNEFFLFPLSPTDLSLGDFLSTTLELPSGDFSIVVEFPCLIWSTICFASSFSSCSCCWECSFFCWGVNIGKEILLCVPGKDDVDVPWGTILGVLVTGEKENDAVEDNCLLTGVPSSLEGFPEKEILVGFFNYTLEKGEKVEKKIYNKKDWNYEKKKCLSKALWTVLILSYSVVKGESFRLFLCFPLMVVKTWGTPGKKKHCKSDKHVKKSYSREQQWLV